MPGPGPARPGPPERIIRTGPGGRRKAQQIRETGAEILVAPCANCKKQLREICEDNDLEEVEVVGLHDLLLKLIDLDGDGLITWMLVEDPAGGWILGQGFLDAGARSFDLPAFGTVKVTSALFFDIGVYLVVAGMVATTLDAFGVPNDEAWECRDKYVLLLEQIYRALAAGAGALLGFLLSRR